MKKPTVPVFMYHSVGIPDRKWKWNYLTIHYKEFEKQLIFLKKKGYYSAHLDELYNHINGTSRLPEKTVILTFDDGYVDNYIFAFPLLQKYCFKGTIFVNPHFVDQKAIKRNRLDQVNSTKSLETVGFLSWNEMIEMEKSNLIDIQSHALTHTWYPISDKIIDFRHPYDNYIWMSWNKYPSRKPLLQIDDQKIIEFGAPVFEHEKSLNATRFYPNKLIHKKLAEYVKANGGRNFFDQKHWRSILFNESRKVFESINSSGFHESNEEKFKRQKEELALSKSILEAKLNKTVNFLCWPGGSGSTQMVSVATKLGYKMTTSAKDLPKKIRKNIKNDGTIYPNRIGRISPIALQKGNHPNIQVDFFNGMGMWLRILAFKSNSKIVEKTIRAMILIYTQVKRLVNAKLLKSHYC